MAGSEKIAVIGGDARFYHLTRMLSQDGWEVRASGNAEKQRAAGVEYLEKTQDACRDTAAVVLPLPIIGSDGNLNAVGEQKIDAYALLAQLPRSCIVCGGLAPTDYGLCAARHGLRLFDYYQREEFAVANCVPTAEGAIEVAMRELPVTLHGTSVLVIGWGRVGKALAVRLHALGADVTVSARKPGDFAGIASCGMKTAHTEHLSEDAGGILHHAAVIFNTVPWPVLGWEELAAMSPECLYIELASAPGGMDAQAAEYTQLRVIRAAGLPGQVAPVTAARILKDTLYNIWHEQGLGFPQKQEGGADV